VCSGGYISPICALMIAVLGIEKIIINFDALHLFSDFQRRMSVTEEGIKFAEVMEGG
jgi:hypothetical protein